MYADTLDAMGMAAFKMTVDSAGALPAMFAISVDTIQDSKLDGGESFEGTSVDHVHTGLALAGTVDAGTMEVNYTTQSLVVGAHHERDQVMGYTGNVLDGDMRDTGAVALSIRYIDGNGRSRSFTAKEWNPKNATTKDGVTTFTGLPADENIIVQASVAEDAGVMLLDPDELAAYTGTEANGITGGHFGDQGGYSHTVSLCPLQAANPQDHGECSSFAYVNTYSVTGLVWKNTVKKVGDDFAINDDPDDGIPGITTFVDGLSVSLDPVEGKNIAGEAQAFTTLKKKDAKTDHPDDTHAFLFKDVAAGAYKLTVPDGWRARTPAAGETGTKDASGMLGNALSPLGGDLAIDVTPATATVYGSITSMDDGFGLDSVAVTVNNVTVMTDALGRYIAEGITPGRKNQVFFSTSRAGFDSGTKPDSTTITFAANSVTPHNVELAGASKFAMVSGTVTASGTGAGVAGAEIKVDGKAPDNAVKGKLLTGDDGSFTARIPAKDLGMTSDLTAEKAGMSFTPDPFPVAAHSGASTSGINFTGYLHATISGRVVAVGGGPMRGVEVTATKVGETKAAATDTTGATGTFSLSVPFGNYTVAASADDLTFAYTNNLQTVNLGPGQSHSFGDIQTMTFAAVSVKATRTVVEVDVDGDVATNDTIQTYGNIRVTWGGDSTAVPAGYNDAAYVVQHNATADGMFTPADQVVGTQDSARVFVFAAPDEDSVFMVRIVATATDADDTDDVELEDEVRNTTESVAAVDASAKGVKATLDVTTDTTVADTIAVTWGATTNGRSDFRIAVQVTVASLGGSTVWLVADDIGAPTNPDNNTRAWTYFFGANNANITTGWDVAAENGPTDVTVTTAELQAATMLRVDLRQGTETTDVWKAGTPVAITAKPSS